MKTNPFSTPVARLRAEARRRRRAAFAMAPSPARTAMERLAARWDAIADAEERNPLNFVANDA